MSLDFTLQRTQPTSVFDTNITHNLSPMWAKAGVYEALYNSEGKLARDIIEVLSKGYRDMATFPELYEPLNPENSWGTYEHALSFLKKVLENCIEYPDAIINISK